jgi:AcrR family transcriptional regulator
MTVTQRRARSESAKQQRTGDLLDAARLIASNDGVRAVTLAAVTQAAGLHPSAVRRYFDSKEELLLELAEHEWSAWSSALVARLDNGSDLPADAIASAVTETILARPLFCDLLIHVPLSLEDGVSLDRARQYKTTSFEAYDAIVRAVASASATLTSSAATDVISATLALTAYKWQVAHPGPILAELYDLVPRWGHVALNLDADLSRSIRAMIAGTQGSTP